MKDIHYDWIIIGGGISGLIIAEILSREDNKVLLIEKNNHLASETTKKFHEWLHTGSLYTLVPDRMLTTRYLLGAIDDLIEYYSCFDGMNLNVSESGLTIDKKGWFNDESILFKYKQRKINFIWDLVIAKSVIELRKISNHDWLRRRGGEDYGALKLLDPIIFKELKSILQHKGEFYECDSSDLTMNSRLLITDILEQALMNGLAIELNSNVIDVDQNGETVSVKTQDKNYYAKNTVICSPELIAKQEGLTIKQSYAPIVIVENVPKEARNFVELDYYYKNCINLLKKGDGIGQAGGISVHQESKVDEYLEFLIREHKKRYPSIEMIGSYVGVKKELVRKGQNRNYEYHIHKTNKNIWSVVLGKFTLAFSLAPEFYRRIYHKNPSTNFNAVAYSEKSKYIDNTSWEEIVKNQE